MDMINECGYGYDEPDYEFQERLSKVLGLNSKWLKSGIGMPYQNDLKTDYSLEKLQREIDDVNNIYFLLWRIYIEENWG